MPVGSFSGLGKALKKGMTYGMHTTKYISVHLQIALPYTQIQNTQKCVL